jgi:nucleotidyltransferase/DNA polymerase involved in DNA repair
VVLHHCLLTLPASVRGHGTLAWWLTATPLRLLVDGPGAVLLFFVLSGFVLAAAIQSSLGKDAGGFDYGRFAAKRFVRIYPPFAFAVLISAGLYLLIQPGPVAGLSVWFNTQSWAYPVAPAMLAGHFLMTDQHRDMTLINVMWSLIHELRISMIFPLIFFGMRARPAVTLTIAAILSAGANYALSQGGLSPLVQTLSLDEAWVDLSGTERLNGGPAAFQLIRFQKQIEQETGLTVSIGLAPNRFLAKMASEMDKPHGFSVIGAGDAQALLAPRSVTALPGVGPVFGKALRSDGYATIGDLARADVRDLVKRYGESGLRLYDLAHARDARAVNPERDRKGMSAETTFNEDLSTAEALEAELWPLCEKLASKARRYGVASRVLVLKLRRTDFKIVTRRISLAEPVQTARALFAAGRDLLRPELGPPYRLIGIGMADIQDAEDAPAGLFQSAETRLLKTERAIDRLREKFGKDAVVACRALKT